MALMSQATRGQRRVTYTCLLRLPIAAKMCSAALFGRCNPELAVRFRHFYDTAEACDL